jgi:hypothetical protein
MKNNYAFLLIACGALFVAGCQSDSQVPEPQSRSVSARKGVQDNFTAHLTSDQEVRTPAVVSKAQGQGILKFSKDGLSVSYQLNVSNIENITMAHLHKGVAGTNGGVVVDLILQPGIPGTSHGVVAKGTFTAAQLKGALLGQSLEGLRTALMNGEIYFNVHTSAYTGGEIRGQVK